MSNNIEFSDEQAMLLDSAREFAKSQSSIELVRARLDDDRALPISVWTAMTELGWAGIVIPEEHGGLGLGFNHLVPIVECMGRQLMASPLIGSAIAAHALSLAGTDEQKSQCLPALAAGAIGTMGLMEAGGSWDLSVPTCAAKFADDQLVLSGTKVFVEDANIADFIIVSVLLEGQPRLVLIEAASIDAAALSREVIIDETRRSFRLTLDDIQVPKSNLLLVLDFNEIELAAMLLLSAEMAGSHASTLDLIVEYLKTRKQFDRYIGSYQALKHPTVDILIGLEASRSQVYHAATGFDTGTRHDRELAVRMAKAVASEGCAFAGDRAIQFHGGFGFTFECDAQLYLRRALWGQHQFGDEAHQRTLLAPLMLLEETG
ncbi:MAG: acyl-CoA dehydrogenase [Candidatus Azotimanducaceae bacterium]|jgi:acyl-CoA dehydrogenase